MRIVLLLCSIFLTSFPGLAQQKEVSPQKTTASRKSVQQAASRQNSCQLSEAERQGLEKDLEKMRTLIEQMQRNLAAAATGESPLKYQFQLDIDMWQLLVQQMERRLEGSTKR